MNNMQNMKLLDLQTGKYLELGKDWLYGGEYIVINTCKIGYSVYEAIQHKDSEKFFKYDKDCLFTDELNEPLKTLCEKTGAVVYGGRYVLIKTITQNGVCVKDGDILQNTKYCQYGKILLNTTLHCLPEEFKEMIFYKVKIEGNKCDVDMDCKVIGNIFEEYSKQLRNEPNKFKELMELIK
jgi:hypothetical protein